MKLDKLVKQISRDAKANPKKAALLGVMALVALYFWAPLMAKFCLPKSGKHGVKTTNAGLILTDDPVEPAEKAKSTTAAKFHWAKVKDLIEHDPRMTPAAYDEAWSDPFAVAIVHTPEAEEMSVSAPEHVPLAEPSPVTPEDAGLVASNILISPRRKTVMINGDTYRENEIVSAALKDNPSTVFEFRVIQIDRQRITLEREGKTYVLELSKSGLAAGDQIQRTTKPVPTAPNKAPK